MSETERPKPTYKMERLLGNTIWECKLMVSSEKFKQRSEITIRLLSNFEAPDTKIAAEQYAIQELGWERAECQGVKNVGFVSGMVKDYSDETKRRVFQEVKGLKIL